MLLSSTAAMVLLASLTGTAAAAEQHRVTVCFIFELSSLNAREVTLIYFTHVAD
jgi:hypothetical protein